MEADRPRLGLRHVTVVPTNFEPNPDPDPDPDADADDGRVDEADDATIARPIVVASGE